MPVNQSNNSAIKFIKFWLPVWLWMGFIFYSSSIPGSDIPAVFPFQDILFHLFIYLMLAYFFSRALKNTSLNTTSLKIILLTTVFASLYGLTDEVHQAFVPYRSISGFDIFIDGVGSFMGSLTQFLFKSH